MYPTGTDKNSVFNKKWDIIWMSTIDYTYITYQKVPLVQVATGEIFQDFDFFNCPRKLT